MGTHNYRSEDNLTKQGFSDLAFSSSGLAASNLEPRLCRCLAIAAFECKSYYDGFCCEWRICRQFRAYSYAGALGLGQTTSRGAYVGIFNVGPEQLEDMSQ